MLRRIVSLLQKELREHGLAGCAVFGFVGAVYMLMLFGLTR
jgi:hypothetical protein